MWVCFGLGQGEGGAGVGQYVGFDDCHVVLCSSHQLFGFEMEMFTFCVSSWLCIGIWCIDMYFVVWQAIWSP